jgi:hypothetical protein
LSETEEALRPFEARQIIESLRKGAVPTAHVARFTVGRERWLRYIRSDLQEYIAQGGSKIRFINGDYGDGKTHFLSVIRHVALQEGFAVAFVVLTRDVPLHRFELVYRELVRRVAGSAGEEGIRALVRRWIEGLPAGAAAGGAEGEGPGKALAETLRGLPEMDLSFANALLALVSLHHEALAEGESAEERESARETLYQWLEGEKLSKRLLKPHQVFEVLDKTNNKRLLASLVSFLQYIGHKGLVVLFDEVETVMAQSASIRSAAFENIRLLIDSTDQSRFLHLFFSIIPDVLSSEKGFRSYDALWSRVRTLGDDKRTNYRSVLIDLHRTPLGKAEFLQLGRRLAEIHGLAHSWDASSLDPDLLGEICTQQERLGLASEVRLFIRQVITALDHAEQGEEVQVDVAGQLSQAREELEQEKREKASPKWDS